MRLSGLMVIVAAMTATALESSAARQKGALELGGFLTVAYFDRSLNLDQGEVGFGAVLGYGVSHHVGVEGEIARVAINGQADADTRYVPLRFRATHNHPLSEDAALLVGAGYVHTFYSGQLDDDDDGITGLVALRLGIQEAVQLRLGTYLDFLPGANDDLNYGLNLGVSYLFRTQAPDGDHDGVMDAMDKCPGTPMEVFVDTNGCSAAQRDSDRDGVNDRADRCSATAAGERVNAEGCPLPKDADGDKVPDASDTCPGTPAGATVDARGCTPSQRDTDRDGVNDSVDRCANTPANTPVDAAGCPKPKDSDGDSVTDDLDRCPNTAAGTQVDARGCLALSGGRTPLALKGVTFETGKAAFTTEAQNILRGVAQALNASPEVRLEVQGHTDNTGSRAFNLRLSKARADAVRTFLIEQGITADRLTAKGYGPDKPVAPNTTPEGRVENRRVALQQRP